MTIEYRAADIETDDADFVIATWSRGYKHSRSAGIIPDDEYPALMHRWVRKIIERDEVLTVIACEKNDPSFVYGFISATPASSPPVVYFCYVKEPYRRGGHARGLLRAVCIDPAKRFAFTCWTPTIAKFREQIPLAEHIPEFARIPGYVEDARSTQQWKR